MSSRPPERGRAAGQLETGVELGAGLAFKRGILQSLTRKAFEKFCPKF